MIQKEWFTVLKLSQSLLAREGLAARPKTRVRYPTRINKALIERPHMLNLNLARRENHHCVAALLKKLSGSIYSVCYCSGGHPFRPSMQHRGSWTPKAALAPQYMYVIVICLGLPCLSSVGVLILLKQGLKVCRVYNV